MKKYLLGIMSLILSIGFSAFTINSNTANFSNETYTWHKYNAAGTAELSPVVTFTGSAAEVKTAFGCPDGNTVNCARAYNSTGNPLNIFVKKVAE